MAVRQSQVCGPNAKSAVKVDNCHTACGRFARGVKKRQRASRRSTPSQPLHAALVEGTLVEEAFAFFCKAHDLHHSHADRPCCLHDESLRRHSCAAARLAVEHEGMDARTFVRVCKECHVFDKSFKTIDAELIFASVAQHGHHHIDVCEFASALSLVAEKKGADPATILDALMGCEGLVKDASNTFTRSILDGDIAVHDRSPHLDGLSAVTGSQPKPDDNLRRRRPLSQTPANECPLDKAASSIMELDRIGWSSVACAPGWTPTVQILDNLSSWISSLPSSPAQRRRILALDANTLVGSPSRSLLRARSAPKELHTRGSTAKPREPGNYSPVDGQDVGFSRLGTAFKRFCGHHDGMFAKDFEQLCRLCLLLDRSFTSVDAADVFTAASDAGCLDFASFDKALRLVAEGKCLPEESVHRAVEICSGCTRPAKPKKRDMRTVALQAMYFAARADMARRKGVSTHAPACH